MTPYAQGQQDAVAVFGLTKTAAGAVAAKSMSLVPKAPGLLSKFKHWLPTWAGTKKMMIGEPGKFWDELVNRKLFNKGSLIRQGFHAPGAFNKALFYGLPALDVVSTMRSDSPDKPGDIAGILGGTAASMAAFRPLGMVGAMAAGSAGSALGRGIVSAGRKLTGNPVQAPAETPAIPYNQFYPYAPGADYMVNSPGSLPG